ncbi:GNAT family N-acetyltransferase [Auraticoccus monumenti]|uniref:Ribosomal-protein-alanine N-acetyltransferase n=1 Tax=Auraticoccus monumenti TaxID=675864 RepID=A0A1G6YLK0_9ACTN|nr:GNAT family protein [Auraticoccus monumenti]SDD90557.1 ribosomal-protein-alanine N-acetyltransferase [Auraticoccus monumenti]
MREVQWPVALTHARPDGTQLRLQPIRRRDRAAWTEVRGRNATWLRRWEATLPPGSPPGPASFAALVRLLVGQARQGRAMPWLIHLSEGADQPFALVGQLTVSGIVGGSAAWGQIGYWVDQRVAGRGIVPTAVAMAVDHCFGTVGMHRIEIAIRPENAASLRVVDKLGLRHEGLRPRYLHIDGDWRDHLVFALNAEEVPDGLLQRWERLRG